MWQPWPSLVIFCGSPQNVKCSVTCPDVRGLHLGHSSMLVELVSSKARRAREDLNTVVLLADGRVQGEIGSWHGLQCHWWKQYQRGLDSHLMSYGNGAIENEV